VEQGTITSPSYPFFNLVWHHPSDKVKTLSYHDNAITALANSTVSLIQDEITLLPISIYLTDYHPPIPPVLPSYRKLRDRAKKFLMAD